MAFGLRYYNEFTSQHYQRLVRVEILERDYTGDSEQIKMGASLHLSDSGDGREVPVKKLTASLRLVSERNFQFEHLFTADDRKYQVKIFRNGVMVFIGFLESDSYSEPYYSYKNYTVNLTARDNLGRLEDIPYDPITGLIFRVDNVLGNVLQQTGLSLPVDDNVQIYSSDMNQSNPTLGQTWLNERKYVDEDGEQESGLFVLEDILKGFGSQIRQVNGQWVVEEQANFYDRPTVQGNSASFPSYLRDRLNFPEITKAFRWINRDAEMVIQPAYKELKLVQDYLVPDSFFDKFPTGEDSFGNIINGPRQGTFLADVKQWDMNGNRVWYSERLYNYIAPYIGIVNDSFISADYPVKETDDAMFINLGYSALYDRANRGVAVSYVISPVIDVLLSDGVQTKILDDTGWVDFTGQSKLLQFSNVTIGYDRDTDLSLAIEDIPFDGDLTIKIYFGLNYTTQNEAFKIGYIDYKFELSEITNNLTVDINENNNTNEEFDIELGQVQEFPNSVLRFYGGLFDTNQDAQIDWQRPGDTTQRNLLEVVGIGYDLMNRQPSRQVTGTVLWDFDVWTNIDDQNKRLMINAIDEWNMNTDEMTAEFIEVFKYNNEIGEFDDGYNDDYNNQAVSDYTSDSTFTITEKFE